MIAMNFDDAAFIDARMLSVGDGFVGLALATL